MSRIIVSQSDLLHNIDCIRTHIKTTVIAVLKMNGYGITLRYAADVWIQGGIRFFAVSTVEEAFELLSLGYEDIEILLMTPVFDGGTLSRLIQSNVILTVTSSECALAVANAGRSAGCIPRAHVKIDTGMGRFGLNSEEKGELLKIYSQEDIRLTGIYSHFAESFEKKYCKTKKQLKRFLEVLSFLAAQGIERGMAHIAASCAALRFRDTWLDAVRIGSALVGRLPCDIDLTLRRVGYIETQAADIRLLREGETSGYAMIYKAKKDTLTAVVPLGYRNGFGLSRPSDIFRLCDLPLYFLHGLKMYVQPSYAECRNQRIPVIGRVGGQFTLFDVTNCNPTVNDVITADADILLVDSSVERVLVS